MKQRIKAHCEDCGKETNQQLLFKKEYILTRDKGKYDFKEWYMTTQCAGCDKIHFVLRTFLPMKDGKKQHRHDEIYPSYIPSTVFINEDEQDELPVSLYNLYEEVKAAFDADSPILAGVGLRILVEGICLHQKIKGKNLKVKIANLQVTGFISMSEVPFLDKLREIGNFAAHEMKGLQMDKLYYALGIVNHALRSIYILPKINKRLKIVSIKRKSVPKHKTVKEPSANES